MQMKLWKLFFAAVSIAAGGYWFWSSPGPESLLALLGTIPLINELRSKRKLAREGLGGRAIVGSSNANLRVENHGVISAGKGGTGGGGGDAIHVAEGVKVTIVNRGEIRGGDAGSAD